MYLTYPSDLAHGIVINFHTTDNNGDTIVYYDTVSHTNGSSTPTAPVGATYKFSAKGQNAKLQFLEKEGKTRYVHWVVLDGTLLPNTTYYFIAGHGSNPDHFSIERKFRTVLAEGGLRFAVGGDVGYEEVSSSVLHP